MKVKIDICLELELAGTYQEYENDILSICESRGLYGVRGENPYVVMDSQYIEEISSGLVNIPGVRIKKVYIDNIDVEEFVDEARFEFSIGDD